MKTATFAFLPSPDACEAIALAGIDRIVVDREHASTEWHEVRAMTVAAQARGAEVFVRVRALEQSEILPALELGVDGIMLPFVTGPEDVQRLRKICRYSPEGERGTCTLTRAARYGLLRDEFAQHTQGENRRVKLVGLLEADLDDASLHAIAAVGGGLDGVLIGRSDLAASLGRPGAVQDEEVIAASTRMVAACVDGGVEDIGMVVYGANEFPQWAAIGVTTAYYSADTAILARTYHDFVTLFARAESPSRKEEL